MIVSKRVLQELETGITRFGVCRHTVLGSWITERNFKKSALLNSRRSNVPTGRVWGLRFRVAVVVVRRRGNNRSSGLAVCGSVLAKGGQHLLYGERLFLFHHKK